MAEFLTGKVKEDLVTNWRAENDGLHSLEVVNTFKGGVIDFRPYPIDIKDLGTNDDRRKIWFSGIVIGAYSLMCGLDFSIDIEDELGEGKLVPYPSVNSKTWKPGDGVDPDTSPVYVFSPEQLQRLKNLIQQPSVTV